MRALVIDRQLKERIEDIIDYARANPYIVGETVIPGDDSRHVLNTGSGYRCVFSFTRTDQGFYRDLSISVETEGKFPNPVAAFTLAKLFGFSGWELGSAEPPADWIMAKDIHFDAIRIVQPLPE